MGTTWPLAKPPQKGGLRCSTHTHTHTCTYTKRDTQTYRAVLTLSISRTGLAASSRQQDRIVTGRLRTFVLDVATLDAAHDATLLLELEREREREREM